MADLGTIGVCTGANLFGSAAGVSYAPLTTKTNMAAYKFALVPAYPVSFKPPVTPYSKASLISFPPLTSYVVAGHLTKIQDIRNPSRMFLLF